MEAAYVFLCLVGFLLLVYLALKWLCAIFRCIYPFFIARPKHLATLAGAKWAVVTGGSDGIGKAYAQQLSNKGFNIMLIARSGKKLKNVAQEIQNTKLKSDSVKWVAFDFANPSVEDYEKFVFPQLDELDIGILVNNVGAIDYTGRYHEIPGGYRKIAQDLIVNTVPHTILTAYVLKQMVARGHGIIVNVSSVAALHPMLNFAIYSSVKKFLGWFAEILRKDYKGNGIIIQTLYTGGVYTKMLQNLSRQKTGFFTPMPDKYAQQAVRTIGHVDETTGYFAHQIQCELASLIPKFLLDLLIKKRWEKEMKQSHA